MPTTNQSIMINASISDVWNKVRNFHDFSWAPNVITSTEKVGELDGTTVGAKRILNDVFHETLIEIDDDKHLLRYSIDDGPSPVSKTEVSNYIGTVSVSSGNNNGRAMVEWNSSWDSNVEDAVEFCHEIYVALLGELDNAFKS